MSHYRTVTGGGVRLELIDLPLQKSAGAEVRPDETSGLSAAPHHLPARGSRQQDRLMVLHDLKHVVGRPGSGRIGA